MLILLSSFTFIPPSIFGATAQSSDDAEPSRNAKETKVKSFAKVLKLHILTANVLIRQQF